MKKKRVLIGSPVYQKPDILSLFLQSLKNLQRETVRLDYVFVDDNLDPAASKLLKDFSRSGSQVTIFDGKKRGGYHRDEETHYWNYALMLKVANYKNKIIEYALKQDYDYLFFVDSDLLLHPYLLEHLKACNKQIISEIFWTKWGKKKPLEPNVWLFDVYDLVPKKLGEKVPAAEKEQRRKKFLKQLKVPGVYEVGGLGACTLISRRALEKGVNFAPIKNITFPGEDRFFCIRAAVLGLGLYVDTHYPAFHIYRQSDLKKARHYFQKKQRPFRRHVKKKGNKLTLSMVVKNEADRYLAKVLTRLKNHLDQAVIIDDGSTDQTLEICQEILADVPLKIVRNQVSLFANEIELRKKQWHETIKTKPDWILNLDADEVLEKNFGKKICQMINQQDYDVYCFRLYDFWTKTAYREDEFWKAHHFYRPFLVRYQPEFIYRWRETPQHCGRFPANILDLPMCKSSLRVKHYGWAAEADRIRKYRRYRRLDPGALYGHKEQYESILDENPTLISWTEGSENIEAENEI